MKLVDEEDSVKGMLAGMVVGAPMIAFGVYTMLQHLDASPPSSFLRFFIGGDVLHDVIVAPVAGVIGLVVLRRAPQIVRGPLRAALFGTAIIVAISWPAIRMYGRMRAPDNISVQPLNYATAVATCVAVVWVVCAVWFAVALLRSRPRVPASRAPSPAATPPDES